MTVKGSKLGRLLRGGYKIKLCRIETLQGAMLALAAQLDFIGLHVIYRLSRRRRRVLSQILQLIAARSAQGSSTCYPVLVTLSQNLKNVAKWCHQIGIDCVQIQNQDLVPDAVSKWRQRTAHKNIEVIKVFVISSANGIQRVDEWEGVAHAALFDSSKTGGSGQRGDWVRIQNARSRIPTIPAFIAGGITPDTAIEALKKTETDAVDIQSHCEIARPWARGVGGRVRRRKRKDISAVLKLCANVRGKTEARARQEYMLRRADSKLILSIADLNPNLATRSAILCENLAIDGIQIDASDGSFVAPWPKNAARHAKMAWSRAPECPIWLHIFATDFKWIAATVQSVASHNSHLVGIVLQCPPTVGAHKWLGELLRLPKRLGDYLIMAGFSAGQIGKAPPLFARALLRTAGVSARSVLITTPSTDRTLTERIRATQFAISTVREATRASEKPWRVGLDRKVTLSFLRRLDERPDFSVIGSALLDGDFSGNTRAFRELLS